LHEATDGVTRRNIPFAKFRGLKSSMQRARQGMLALLRFVENRTTASPASGSCICCPGVEPTSAQRLLDRMAESADPIGALCALPSPARAGDDWKVFNPSAICVTPSGRPTSNAQGSGTNRTWIASTKTH
jgi:hypothetical protein